MLDQIDSNEFLRVVMPAIQAGDASALARLVQVRWRCRDLCQLLKNDDVDVRRVVAVTLGMAGSTQVVGCLTRALRDPDEQVNEMAEHALWSIWFRAGNAAAAQPFREGVAQLASEAYDLAAQSFTAATRADPTFAEAYNQCGIAHFFLYQWSQAIEDCRQAVRLMPTHFGAIAGIGHCYTQLGDLSKALACYRRAVEINPRMSAITGMITRLKTHLVHANDASGLYLVKEQ